MWCVCGEVGVARSVHVTAVSSSDQKRASDPLELQVVVMTALECGFWYNCTELSTVALFLLLMLSLF